MGPDAPSGGLLAWLLVAFSCFPKAREKSKAATVKESEFQCLSCGIRKRRTTIIAGSGIIGLSTAYWIGRTNKSKRPKTIVLEARNQYFQGASGHNSGLLSCHWFSGGLRQLADHSFSIYQDLARKQTNFKSASDYHENSLFQAHCGEGPTDPRAPHWIKVAEGWHLESEPATRFIRKDKTRNSSILQDNPSSATINPKGLGKWLYDRCLEYGVCIETDCTLFKVHLCDCGKLRSVLVKSAQGVLEYECDDLVFAAGTRTPQLVRELFPDFSRDFHETTNSGNWIVVKAATALKYQTRAEVILDDVVDHQLEFVGRENQKTHDFVIWVCGLNNEETKPSNIADQEIPDEDAINRLRHYATKFLRNGESAQQEGPEVLEKGRTYRPTIDRELPILTSVSFNDLYGSRISKERFHQVQRDSAKTGVWVCTGHGKYGMTLGLGSGKLMSQMILGEKPDLDVTALGFPL